MLESAGHLPSAPEQLTPVTRGPTPQKKHRHTHTTTSTHPLAQACCLPSGRAWTGRQALKLGLIDGIGDLKTVMRQQYGDKVSLGVAV